MVVDGGGLPGSGDALVGSGGALGSSLGGGGGDGAGGAGRWSRGGRCRGVLARRTGRRRAGPDGAGIGTSAARTSAGADSPRDWPPLDEVGPAGDEAEGARRGPVPPGDPGWLGPWRRARPPNQAPNPDPSDPDPGPEGVVAAASGAPPLRSSCRPDSMWTFSVTYAPNGSAVPGPGSDAGDGARPAAAARRRRTPSPGPGVVSRPLAAPKVVPAKRGTDAARGCRRPCRPRPWCRSAGDAPVGFLDVDEREPVDLAGRGASRPRPRRRRSPATSCCRPRTGRKYGRSSPSNGLQRISA